jgi:ABC-type multidrug transport system fused ATPase/permease subunit
LIHYFKPAWLQRSIDLGLSYRVIIILIVLSLTATVTEVLGVGIFLPIFQFIRLNGDINALVVDSSFWQYAVDLFLYFNIELSLAPLLILSFSLFIGRQIFVYLRLVYTVAVKQRLIQIQRNRIFDKYIDADAAYHDSVPVGNLVNVISTEVNRAVAGVMAPLELMVYLIIFTAYIGVLSVLSWEMTLFSAIVILFSSFVPKIWIKQSATIGRKLVNANTLMSEFLIGRLRSPRLVRLSGTERAEKNEFHNLTFAQRKNKVFNSILQSKIEAVMEPIVIGLSFIFLYFSYTALQLQVETIGLYLLVAMRLMPVIKSIMIQIQSIQSMLGSIEALEDRLKTMKESQEQDNGINTLSQIKQSILIDKVNYRYPEAKDDALKSITIEFKVNEMVAIVGPSGSGKSTLIDLLPRLRLPTEGIIKIDGENIEKYRLESLRQLIAYAPQFPQIFDGTVKNHILYGKSDATDNEIQVAARMAGVEEFVNQLPQGYATILGEDAVKLSGGQRQRLDLARALVRKAKILILDEPTSNLDAESEEMFKKILSRIRKETNTIIVVVAHRLASIADADKIVVLSQGMVEGIGCHRDLLKKNNWYAEAWKVQESNNVVGM